MYKRCCLLGVDLIFVWSCLFLASCPLGSQVTARQVQCSELYLVFILCLFTSRVATAEPSKMTTAARPTFEPARGGRGKGEGDLSALSKQYSSRDLPGHTKIKYRSVGWVDAGCIARHCFTSIIYLLILKVYIYNIYIFFSLSSDNPPRMPLRRCVPVTSAGSWRRGSV